MNLKYSQSVYAAAEQKLAERKQRAELEQQARQRYVYEKLPEVEAIERRMSTNYCTLLRAIATHTENAKLTAEKLRDRSLVDRERVRILVKDLTGDADYLEVKYSCKNCGDTGYREGERCQCLKDLLRQTAVEEFNSRSTIRLRDFGEFDPTIYPDPEQREKMLGLKRLLEGYAAHFPDGSKSLILTGHTGLGKTFLSSCIATAVAGNGHAVAFSSASDLLRSVENEHFGRAEGDTLSAVIAADLLIIDDLGSEFHSPFNDATLYNIINGRINLNRRTIISTNLDKLQLDRRYGERIGSRLIGEFIFIPIGGSDLRQEMSSRKRTAAPIT